MMRMWMVSLLCVIGLHGAAAQSLQVYFIDALGGGCTLIVTPAGESILVDSGWRKDDARDANLIVEALRDAGCERLDISLTTHWHRDHFGAIGQVAEMVDVVKFYDKGVPAEFPDDPSQFPTLIGYYNEASGGESTTLRAGDQLILNEGEEIPVVIDVLAADRNLIGDKPGLATNPHCADCEVMPYDKSDNAASIAFLLTYGDFQFFVGGDITWNIENRLVCPTNVIGEVDLLQVNHHGLASSNNPVFLRSVNPTVAVICNGPRKGGHPHIVKRLRDIEATQAIYQIHRNEQASDEENTVAELIANPDNPEGGAFIKVEASANESFVVTIPATGHSGTYAITP